MDGPSLLVGGLMGLFVGLTALIAFRYSERSQHELPPLPEPELDEGLIRTLAVLRSAAVVLDDDDAVVRASPLAYALGVVQAGGKVNPVITPIVAAVRRDGVIQDTELELSRGKLGASELLLQVRVAQVTPHHLLILADDHTQARRLEAIRRDFVVNVSHELKTPVGALSLLAETVGDAADDPEAVRRFAATMQKEATRLAALVHEIIELSRLQVAGALEQPGLVRVDEVIREAAERAQTTAGAKGVDVTVGASENAQVYGDHALLVTAVRNLVDNAVAYSDPGGHVGLGVHSRDGIVEIAVVDQGIGIPVEQQVRIFERFYRVDPARSRETGGTGLGLSIVKHVAADHGGDVTVWSEPGRGSTFTLRLPAATLPPGVTEREGVHVGALPDDGADDDGAPRSIPLPTATASPGSPPSTTSLEPRSAGSPPSATALPHPPASPSAPRTQESA